MRKTFLLLSFVLFITSISFAQVEKGNLQLGATLRFERIEQGTIKTSSLQSDVIGGYFLSDKWSVGAVFGYDQTRFEQVSERLEKDFTYGLYGRLHLPLVSRLYFFAQPQIVFGSGSFQDTGSTVMFDTELFDVSIAPGIIYFPNRWIGIEVRTEGFFYRKDKVIGTSAQETESYGFDFNLNNMRVGVSFYFGNSERSDSSN